MASDAPLSGIRPIASVAADRLLAAPGREPAQRDARIEIADGSIASVTSGAAPAGPSSADIGGPGMLVLPGLTNAHDHGRGLRRLAYGATDAALELWLPQLGVTHPAVDSYTIHAVAFARMARAGITSVVHCHVPQRWDNIVEEAEHTCRAAADVGIRLAFVVPLRDINMLGYGDPEHILAHCEADDRDAIRSRWGAATPPLGDQFAFVHAIAAACESDTVQVQFGPYADAFASRAILERVADESAATGRRVHMHSLETRLQREWVDATYGPDYVAWLDRIGFLSDRLTLAHGVWFRADECELLAERGVTVSVNTSSNLRLRSGLAPVADFVSYNVPIAIGLDGSALDDDDDMLREMRLTYLLHAGTALDEVLTPARVVTAAAAQGAWAASGKRGYGELAPGHPADLVVLDYAAFAADVLRDGLTGELDLALGRATRHHVSTVIANGREIVRDGQPSGVDLDQLSADLFAQAAHGIDEKMELLPLVKRYQAALRNHYAAGGHRRKS